MKFCLHLEKTAASALLFATLGCWIANVSPAQAASQISTLAATEVESLPEESLTATNLSPLTEATAASTLSLITENLVTDEAIPSTTKVEEIPQQIVEASQPLTQALATQSLSNDNLLTDQVIPATTEVEETTQQIVEAPQPLAQVFPSETEANESMSWETDSLAEDDPMGQVTNVNQLSDVSPGDWAYEALRSLVERYGCIVGYPDGTYRGNRATTRYEFAAGLNACLNQIERLIAASTDGFVRRDDLETLQRLSNEFQAELASLGTRVDALEARTALIEENQFSTTTKLFGQAIFGVQGRSDNDITFFLDQLEDRGTNVNVISNVQLSLFTQFSPRSLLLTGLQAGEGSTAPRNTNDVVLSFEGDTNSDFQLSDLNYRQLVGRRLAFIVGPVGVNPVNVFRGVNRVESAGQGPLSRFAQRNPIINIGNGDGGIGFDWQLATRFSLQGVYSASTADDPGNGGLFGGDNGETSFGTQLVVSPTDNIDISLQYINAYSPFGRLGTGVGDEQLALLGANFRAPLKTNAFGATLEWRVSPRFAVGGWGGYTTSEIPGQEGNVETVNWMAFLNFPDLLGEGNLAGIYVGQPPRITSSDLPVGRNYPSFVNRGDATAGPGSQPDSTLHLEGFYRFRVSDNISVTPGIIVIFNSAHNSDNDTVTIGAIRTTFNF